MTSLISQFITKKNETVIKAPLPPFLVNFLRAVTLPIVGILVFLLIWSAAASNIDTSLGKFPGPHAVSQQVSNLYKDPSYTPKTRAYTGKETFLDQIGTSLFTVLSGFLLAAIIAIPLGIAIGLSKSLNTAINPVIQIFKPVSPLAWLPLVTMVVSALYVSDDPMVAKSFLVSMITVTLCCIWPMVINTSVGVASLDSDWVNVSRVLRLPALKHVQKIVIPASIPAIFTGMRMSLGIAWMVLIAAEMLAQNPGLGKFVWDEFQNGSSDSLSRIMTAVIVIGLIGFALDRTMMQLQRVLSWDKSSEVR
jgi:nitrate/nitrite transport system permease protein